MESGLKESEIIAKAVEESNFEDSLKPLSENQINEEVENANKEIIETAQNYVEEKQPAQFDWAKFKAEKHNAALASTINSHPNLFYALDKAGEIFEKAGHKCLNVDERYFQKEIRKTKDIESLVKTVVEGIRILAAPEIIILDSTDLLAAIAGSLKACLEAETTTASIKKSISRPIIKQGCIAWVYYGFHSEHSFRSKFFKSEKKVDIHAHVKFFCFTSELDFRINLCEAELKNSRKSEAELKMSREF